MRTTNATAKVVLTFVTICFAGFIFANSLLPGQVSGNNSSFVQQLIQGFFDWLRAPVTITEYFIRKSAHFLEFCAFGILVMTTIRQYTPTPARHLPLGLFIGLAVPVADELIQHFVEGRSSQVTDVVLDFSGFVTGLVLFFLFCVLFVRKRKIQPRLLKRY